MAAPKLVSASYDSNAQQFTFVWDQPCTTVGTSGYLFSSSNMRSGPTTLVTPTYPGTPLSGNGTTTHVVAATTTVYSPDFMRVSVVGDIYVGPGAVKNADGVNAGAYYDSNTNTITELSPPVLLSATLELFGQDRADVATLTWDVPTAIATYSGGRLMLKSQDGLSAWSYQGGGVVSGDGTNVHVVNMTRASPESVGSLPEGYCRVGSYAVASTASPFYGILYTNTDVSFTASNGPATNPTPQTTTFDYPSRRLDIEWDVRTDISLDAAVDFRFRDERGLLWGFDSLLSDGGTSTSCRMVPVDDEARFASIAAGTAFFPASLGLEHGWNGVSDEVTGFPVRFRPYVLWAKGNDAITPTSFTIKFSKAAKVRNAGVNDAVFQAVSNSFVWDDSGGPPSGHGSDTWILPVIAFGTDQVGADFSFFFEATIDPADGDPAEMLPLPSYMWPWTTGPVPLSVVRDTRGFVLTTWDVAVNDKQAVDTFVHIAQSSDYACKSVPEATGVVGEAATWRLSPTLEELPLAGFAKIDAGLVSSAAGAVDNILFENFPCTTRDTTLPKSSGTGTLTAVDPPAPLAVNFASPHSGVALHNLGDTGVVEFLCADAHGPGAQWFPIAPGGSLRLTNTRTKIANVLVRLQQGSTSATYMAQKS